MKLLTTFMLSAFIFNIASADENYKLTFTKLDADNAQVLIETGINGESQAAMLVNGDYNQKFLDEMLKDKNSKLSKLKAQIEIENCEENSTEENSYIDGCGEVEITTSVVTSFGRGGWASAGAGYSFFVGFRSAGTGRFYEANYLVNFSEGVEAIGGANDEFDGTFLKTLSLNSIKKL